MENYSLSDIAAVTDGQRNNEGWDGGWFWIVVLFLFMFGFGGNGMWGNNANQGALTRAELCEGFNFNQLEMATRGVQQGLCDGFYAQNTTMLQGFNGVQRDLCTGFASVNAGITNLGYQTQQCCCETNRNIDSVRAENYKNTCEITTAIHAEGEQTRALINANTMQALRDKLEEKDRDLLIRDFQISQQAQNATLVNELRPCAKPAYITCSPYTSANNGNFGCGCGCGNCA